MQNIELAYSKGALLCFPGFLYAMCFWYTVWRACACGERLRPIYHQSIYPYCTCINNCVTYTIISLNIMCLPYHKQTYMNGVDEAWNFISNFLCELCKCLKYVCLMNSWEAVWNCEWSCGGWLDNIIHRDEC